MIDPNQQPFAETQDFVSPAGQAVHSGYSPGVDFFSGYVGPATASASGQYLKDQVTQSGWTGGEIGERVVDLAAVVGGGILANRLAPKRKVEAFFVGAAAGVVTNYRGGGTPGKHPVFPGPYLTLGIARLGLALVTGVAAFGALAKALNGVGRRKAA